MNGLALDASAFVFAYTSASAHAARTRVRIANDRCHAPHLLSAEVGNVARRLVLRGELSAEHGLRLVEKAAPIVARWHAHGPLTRLAWSLRDRVTYYDALYVALAASLGVPLLTTDARLSRTPLPCAVEVVSSGPAPA